MNVWILTIGSSDVQLKVKNNWKKLFREGRSQLKPDRGFSPQPIPDSDRLRVHARVMGVIYSQPQASLDDLEFPLIDNFIQKLKTQKIAIDQVILVLSDQSVFPETKRSQKHPYWQDTCTLQLILEKYLTEQWKDVSPNLEINPFLLEAASEEEGLDNWDVVLTLVQREFTSPDFDLPKDATIYVSHQAGTPAISSAVQFCSLAKFGDRVKFLVSNEYNPKLPEKPLEGSSYLRGIKREQAKQLLKNHDYAGVDQLVGKDLTGEDRTLLDAALKWNVAKFDDSPKTESHESKLSDRSFLEILKHHPQFASEVAERTRTENWWWIAYEEVYLALIRKDQGNIVEAFFHSFRAFEGIFAAWGNQQLGQYFQFDKRIPYLNPSVLNDPKEYFSSKRCKDVSDLKNLRTRLENLRERPIEDIKDDRVELNMATLCKIFKALHYKEYRRDCAELKIFWDNNKDNNVSEQRNIVVHQVQGMSEVDLWSVWGVESFEDWKSRLLKFLNFIVKEDFPEGFATLEEASLMVQVHQKLEKAIVNL